MIRWIRWSSGLFFLATFYLMLAEAVSPWLTLPAVGNVGFTLVFVLFAITHCIGVEGPRRTAIFFAVSAIISYAMEETGVRTGLIYGPYHYGDQLGTKLGHVPLIIPLAWFMMIYPSWRVAESLLKGIDRRSVPGLTALAAVAALVMTAWDLVMDPGMAAAGIWTWEQGGAYFGVPTRNYVGWLLTTFLVYWIVGWWWREVATGTPVTTTYKALPVVIYALFAARYVTAGSLPALQVVALFSMALPALVALIQAYVNLGD